MKSGLIHRRDGPEVLHLDTGGPAAKPVPRFIGRAEHGKPAIGLPGLDALEILGRAARLLDVDHKAFFLQHGRDMLAVIRSRATGSAPRPTRGRAPKRPGSNRFFAMSACRSTLSMRGHLAARECPMPAGESMAASGQSKRMPLNINWNCRFGTRWCHARLGEIARQTQ
jgi:hypothetical protein